MIVLPGPIPITIHPMFWVFAALIGYLSSQTLLGALVWVGIIFVSVLFHEFGHALTAVCFRQKTHIQLVALGGLTSYNGPKLKFWQQFLIVLNGPLAGFCLFLIASFLLQFPVQGMLLGILHLLQMANLFWSLVNLLPVLPLDGGQLLRIALEGFFGIRGFKASLLIGALIGGGLSCLFFLAQQFLVGAFFFLFAFQSFELWRKTRLVNRNDREEAFKADFIQAEQCLQKGDKRQAEELFKKVCEEAPGGLLAMSATQHLAFLLTEEGKSKDAYALLLPIKEHLTGEALCLLHELAAGQQNFSLVAEISSPCYQFAPGQEAALRNARACAFLKQPSAAGGWIQTAWQYGAFDVQALLFEQVFDQVRNDPQFREFVDLLGS